MAGLTSHAIRPSAEDTTSASSVPTARIGQYGLRYGARRRSKEYFGVIRDA